MKFKRKFNVGDLVVPSKRAPKKYVRTLSGKEPYTIRGLFPSHNRTHWFYYIDEPLGARMTAYYSDELDLYKPTEKI